MGDFSSKCMNPKERKFNSIQVKPHQSPILPRLLTFKCFLKGNKPYTQLIRCGRILVAEGHHCHVTSPYSD